jgi:hypothetical protein
MNVRLLNRGRTCWRQQDAVHASRKERAQVVLL